MTRTVTALRSAAALLLAAGVCLGPPAAAADPAVVDLGGAAVEPSTDPNVPTLLTAGVWADVLGPATSADAGHEFSYVRTMADSTVHLGVVGAPAAPDGGDGLAITARVPADDGTQTDCASDQSSASYTVTQRLVGVGLSVGAEDDRDDPCLTAEELTFTVDRGSSSATTDLPIAIRVVEEAPVQGVVTAVPTASDSPRVAVPEAGEPVAVSGTPSFDDAPALEPGTTYADAVPQGGTLLYRVPVGWSASLAVRVDVPVQDAAALRALDSAEPDVELVLLDPLRNAFGNEVEESVDTGDYASDEPSRLVEGSAPVRYANRFDDLTGSVPGDYWVAVAAERAADGARAVDVPFTLVVEVTDDGSAAPTYSPTVQGPGGSTGPEGYAAETPFLIGGGVFASDVSRDVAAAAPPADDPSGRDHVRLSAGIALGAVSLGCCAAGLVLLRRRPRLR